MTTTLALLDIGIMEFALLGAAAVLLFGGDLPDVARKAAVFIGRMRAMSADLTRDLHNPPPGFRMPDELRRPSELDLPKDLDLTSEDRSFSTQGSSSSRATPSDAPSIAEASWRPKTSPPDPAAFPGSELGSAAGSATGSEPATPSVVAEDEPRDDAQHDDAGRSDPTDSEVPDAEAPMPARREDQPPEVSS